jgi:hypothetical protein
LLTENKEFGKGSQAQGPALRRFLDVGGPASIGMESKERDPIKLKGLCVRKSEIRNTKRETMKKSKNVSMPET